MTLGWPWTDRLPVENDPDVAATVAFGGLGGYSVQAMDVMAKWSRELVMSK